MLVRSPDSSRVQLINARRRSWGGVYEGRTGFQRWSEAMASYFDKLEVQDPKVFERSEGDTVVTASTLHLRVRKTGEEWVKPLVQLVRVDREKEVIVEIRPFYWDVAGLNATIAKA